jgi:hypothetical protein
LGKYSLVVLGHASLASLAMLTPQRCPNHARNTKVGLVKLPQPDELVDDGLLLRDAIHFRHEPWILHHRGDIKVADQGEEDNESQVEPPVGFFDSCILSVIDSTCDVREQQLTTPE